MSDKNIVTEIAELAVIASGCREVNAHPYVILGDGQTVSSLENFLPSPLRKKGKICVQDEASFLLIHAEHREDNTVIYADRKKAVFEAVFNDHVSATPGWRDHVCNYCCPFSNEWGTWEGRNGARMNQTDFAWFIEQNLVDITSPSSAEMLEISRTLVAKKSAKFASSVQLSNGSNQFSYEEEIRGTTKSGNVEIPETFKIGIPVFLNGQAYEIEVRLRYRIKDGALEMWYELVRPHDIYEDAFNAIHKSISDATGQDIISADL